MLTDKLRLQLNDSLGVGLVLPDTPDFDSLRQLWNAAIDRRPAAIARCNNRSDVVATVAAAAQANTAVSIRAGGHNIAGTAIGDLALMIDLSGMRAVEIDPVQKIARVEGGATWADFDAAAQAHGLAAPGGIVSSTGVAGLTLGGGFGWLSRLHGLAADNVMAAEIVLADGSVVEASDHSHAELFWALRGGSGNFGVVTRFTFRLCEVGPKILFGPTFFALKDAKAVLAAYASQASGLPREACVWANLMTAPPVPALDPTLHGTKVLSLMQFHTDSSLVSREVFKPLYGGAEPLGDALVSRPFVEAQSFLDATYAFGARNYWRDQRINQAIA